MHPEQKEEKPTEAIPTRIFISRLQQLGIIVDSKDPTDTAKTELLKRKIATDIDALPLESASVREHLEEIDRARSLDFWTVMNRNNEWLKFLKTKIGPLMRYRAGIEYDESSWELKIEKLALAILQGNMKEIERLRDEIREWVFMLPETIQEVGEKKELKRKVLQPEFWANITFEDAQMLLEQFTPLSKYKPSEPNPMILLDLDDFIQQREVIEIGPTHMEVHVPEYKEKVERRIRELAEKDPVLAKIMQNEPLTETDLKDLEKTFNSPELYVTEEALQRIYKKEKGSLVQFIKNILGLYKFPDPKIRIREAFKNFIVQKNYLNSDQVNFLRTMESVFLRNHQLKYDDLFEPPFANFGVNAPVPLFNDDDLKQVIELCSKLESEVF